MSAYLQRLIPGTPIVGEAPDTDPEFGWVYTIIAEVASLASEIQEEIGFDAIELSPNGYVHLTYRNKRVALVKMDGHHADSVLCVEDPA